MYEINWDEETGGILLADSLEKFMSLEVRPVFFEELDLLGFNRYWEYPRDEEPLLWAWGGRKYYYRGELVAEAEGGGMFTPPHVKIYKEGLRLKKVDVDNMLKKNEDLMQGLVQKSLQFIYKAYHRYRKEVDIAAVAFSGGKDSLVLLDLVQRVLEPEQFVVIFSDTGMEVSDTYKALEKARDKWNHLRFYTARCHKDALTTWKEIGPPSRIHRWCCTVHKSAPTLLLLREIAQKPSVKALIFDGVRSAESASRSTYMPITRGGKHKMQINARPILNWNAGEVYLYLFSHRLLFNRSYRYGITRVGCSVCPMVSEWKEAISTMVYLEDIGKFIDELRIYAARAGVKEENVDKYLEKGTWKGRAGGRFLENGGRRVTERQEGEETLYILENPGEDWLEWAKTLGHVVLLGEGKGIVERNEGSYRFTVKKEEGRTEVAVAGLSSADRFTLRDFRAVALKSAYCVHCRSCQVECPTGALIVEDSVSISDECVKCGECLKLGDKSCLAAYSLRPDGGLIMNEKILEDLKLPDYKTFGIEKNWLLPFLEYIESRGEKPSGLGNRQVEAMQQWMEHAELIARENQKGFSLSELGKKVKQSGADDSLVWAVIWVNLCRNSPLVNWYVRSVGWGEVRAKDDLLELMGQTFAKSERTRKNALNALLNLLGRSPLGHELGLGEIREESKKKMVYKKGWQNPLPGAVLYSMYRYAEKKGRYELTVREFYEKGAEEGPYVAFGIGKEELKAILRGLASYGDGLISVDLVKDLDNIFLNPARRAVEILDLS